MITVKLLGGLGNQMFQYAYGLALKERGYQVEYDLNSLVPGTHRGYSLGYFGIKAEGKERAARVYESSTKYNEAHLSPQDPATMVGYWQTEKYFSSIRDKVLEAFNFQGVPVRHVHTIALHIRRQDYVGLQHFHGMPDLDYYREAVAFIRREASYQCPVVVISDDRDWCRENLPSDFILFEGLTKYEDMAMMASCDYAVIANSSFSWWGAWLGPQRLVVAPSRWFTEPSMDYSDIVPERWVKL